MTYLVTYIRPDMLNAGQAKLVQKEIEADDMYVAGNGFVLSKNVPVEGRDYPREVVVFACACVNGLPIVELQEASV